MDFCKKAKLDLETKTRVSRDFRKEFYKSPIIVMCQMWTLKAVLEDSMDRKVFALK